MGIGWTPQWRAKVLDGCIVAAAKSKPASTDADAVVADGPAIVRMYTFRDCSPAQVAKLMRTRMFASVGADGPKIASVWFDNANNMPPARARVAQSRRGEPLTDDEVTELAALGLDTFVPGHLRCTMPWSLIFRCSKAKKAAWEIMAKAIFDELCSFPGVTVEVVSAGQTRVRVGSVVAPALVNNTGYGEADQQVSLRVAALAQGGYDTTVSTVDYDMVLQQILVRNDSDAASYVQFKAETVNIEAVREIFCSKTRDSTLSAAFYLLACFKSDYSKSLSGPAKTRVADLVACMHRAAEGTETNIVLRERRGESGQLNLVFFPRLFAATIKKTSKPVAEQVCNILWTIAYFGLYAPQGGVQVAPPECVPPADLWALSEFVVASSA